MASKENWAEAPKGNEKAGEKIFKTKCAQCHAVDKAAGHKQGNCVCLGYTTYVSSTPPRL